MISNVQPCLVKQTNGACNSQWSTLTLSLHAASPKQANLAGFHRCHLKILYSVFCKAMGCKVVLVPFAGLIASFSVSQSGEHFCFKVAFLFWLTDRTLSANSFAIQYWWHHWKKTYIHIVCVDTIKRFPLKWDLTSGLSTAWASHQSSLQPMKYQSSKLEISAMADLNVMDVFQCVGDRQFETTIDGSGTWQIEFKSSGCRWALQQLCSCQIPQCGLNVLLTWEWSQLVFVSVHISMSTIGNKTLGHQDQLDTFHLCKYNHGKGSGFLHLSFPLAAENANITVEMTILSRCQGGNDLAISEEALRLCTWLKQTWEQTIRKHVDMCVCTVVIVVGAITFHTYP